MSNGVREGNNYFLVTALAYPSPWEGNKGVERVYERMG